jgi:hypothetical protein
VVGFDAVARAFGNHRWRCLHEGRAGRGARDVVTTGGLSSRPVEPEPSCAQAKPRGAAHDLDVCIGRNLAWRRGTDAPPSEGERPWLSRPETRSAPRSAKWGTCGCCSAKGWDSARRTRMPCQTIRRPRSPANPDSNVTPDRLGHSLHSEIGAKLLTVQEVDFRSFSECALILLGNPSDFDSAMRRFESSRPSHAKRLIGMTIFVELWEISASFGNAVRCPFQDSVPWVSL